MLEYWNRKGILEKTRGKKLLVFVCTMMDDHVKSEKIVIASGAKQSHHSQPLDFIRLLRRSTPRNDRSKTFYDFIIIPFSFFPSLHHSIIPTVL